MARAVVPLMLDQGSGRIVTISMNESTMVRRGFVPYGPSGAAVEALSRVMAADLAGSPVTVNLLLPGGATDTGMVPDDTPTETARAAARPRDHGTADCLARLAGRGRGPRRAHRRRRVRTVVGLAMSTVLLTGASGLLGQWLMRTAPPRHDGHRARRTGTACRSFRRCTPTSATPARP